MSLSRPVLVFPNPPSFLRADGLSWHAPSANAQSSIEGAHHTASAGEKKGKKLREVERPCGAELRTSCLQSPDQELSILREGQKRNEADEYQSRARKRHFGGRLSRDRSAS
eukprot:scaffold6835_cov302-Pinguiococcus_pyrenoidosus.AAC.1